MPFAYDDVESILYFDKRLKAYWKRNGKTMEQAIEEAYGDYPALKEREERFSQDLQREAAAAGGEKYAELLALAYRQVMAGHKLVEDEKDGLLYISKECLSNGCAATVDVSYPSMPMFLYYNPELVNAMMRPVLRFARSKDWLYGFAPHDVGCYPHVTGQVYSNGSDPDHQMPIEECGNMLVMAAAAAVAKKDTSLFEQNRDLFEQWVEYLVRYGEDPDDQICTDDFFKHLPHNCNLAVKAIMGIASMAILLSMSGREEEAAPYWKEARRMARSWMERASEGDGSTRLAFDQPGTYSLKYNIVWDKLFGTGLFTADELRREFASYWQYMNPYGLPLDGRGSTSKTDWLAWTGRWRTPRRNSRGSWSRSGGISTSRKTACRWGTGTAPKPPSTSTTSTAPSRAACSSSCLSAPATAGTTGRNRRSKSSEEKEGPASYGPVFAQDPVLPRIVSVKREGGFL